jgi:hypothetical protein
MGPKAYIGLFGDGAIAVLDTPGDPTRVRSGERSKSRPALAPSKASPRV